MMLKTNKTIWTKVFRFHIVLAIAVWALHGASTPVEVVKSAVYAREREPAQKIAPVNYTALGNSLAFGTGATNPATGGYVPRFRDLAASRAASDTAYTAGPTPGTDTIRVTDAASNFVEATVTVPLLDVSCPNATTKVWDGGGATNNWSDAANWCQNTLPNSSSQVVFDGTSTKDATVDIAATISSYTIQATYTGTISIASGVTLTSTNATHNGGTLNVGSGTWSVSSQLTMGGGNFNANNGTMQLPNFSTINNGSFNGGSSTMAPGPSAIFGFIDVNGGSFTATSGTMTLRSFDILGAASFNHNNGTIVMIGGINAPFISSSARTVNNLTLNKDSNTGIATTTNTTVAGTLRLTGGIINSGTLRALGPLVVEPSFGSGSQGGGGSVFVDTDAVSVPRPIDLPAGVRLPAMRFNDTDIQVSSSGSGTVFTRGLTLDAGVISFGANNLTVGYGSGVAPFTQNGGSVSFTSGNFTMNTASLFTLNNGTFSMQTGTALLSPDGFGGLTMTGGTFNAPATLMRIGAPGALSSPYQQSGGVFNGGGDLDINGDFTLTGGTFNAPSGNTFFGFLFSHSAGTFNHSGGTAIFDSSHPSYSIGVTANGNTEVFNNLTINLVSGNVSISGTFQANGNVEFVNGQVSNGSNGLIEARGNLTVGAGADGGNLPITFAGSNNQTLTNNGGVNTTGVWTVNKSGGTVTLLSNLDFAAASGNQTLSLTNGSMTTGPNRVVIGSEDTVVNGNGFVIGNLERRFLSPSNFVFNVGTASGLSPVAANVTAVNGPSSLTVSAHQATLSGFDPLQSLSRNWQLDETGDITATLSFTYRPTDVNGNEASYRVWRRQASGLTQDMCGSPCVNTTTKTLGPVVGVTDFSRWTGSASLAPTSANVTVGGRILTADGRGIRGCTVTLTKPNGEVLRVITSSFGYYRFDNVEVGQSYVISVDSKRFTFSVPTRVVLVQDDLTDVDFVAEPQ